MKIWEYYNFTGGDKTLWVYKLDFFNEILSLARNNE